MILSWLYHHVIDACIATNLLLTAILLWRSK